MEGGKGKSDPVPRLERSFERSRLEEQLWTLAYERVVPLRRETVRQAPHRDSPAGVAQETREQEPRAAGAGCR